GAARARRGGAGVRPTAPAARDRALTLRGHSLRAAGGHRGGDGTRARRAGRARARGGDLERARELLAGGEARDRRERYLALARAAYADERFDPGAAARAVA